MRGCVPAMVSTPSATESVLLPRLPESRWGSLASGRSAMTYLRPAQCADVHGRVPSRVGYSIRMPNTSRSAKAPAAVTFAT